MSTFSKIVLSGSTKGEGILITGTSLGSGTTIHTPSATATDEIWIWADSTHTTTLLFNVEFGELSTDPADVIHQDIYPDLGLQLMVPGLIIVADASPVIAGFCGTASQIAVFGYVIRETA